MHWLRLYNDVINDPKVLKLPEATRWHWVALLCVASKNDGILPPLDDISIQLRVTTAKATEILAALVKVTLLDKTETGFAPHNWNGRQYKSDVSTERVKRFRQRKGNVSHTVSETPPDTETETDRSEANASGADAPPDPSEPEREFFRRGKQVLGKSAGGQLAKLLSACGRNVSLARSKLELAATKDNAAAFVAGVIRAGPVTTAKPLTAHQQEREIGRGVLDDIGNFISSGGQADLGILRHDSSHEPQGVRGRPGGNLIELSPASRRESG